MKTMVNAIYDSLLDMDFMDYEELKEEELNDLLADLELLNEKGNGTLLNVIKMLVENN